jgi:hypothetical protein
MLSLFGPALFACAIGGFWGFLSAGKLLAKDGNTLTPSRAVGLGALTLITIVVSYVAMEMAVGIFAMALLGGRMEQAAVYVIVIGLLGFAGTIYGSKMGVSLIRRLHASSSAPKQS